MAVVRKLTTTSYAVLGLLAIGPLTTYELARQVGRLGDWLQSRSKLFEEPKRLAEAGLVTATASATGRRPSTVYAVTELGRSALAAWLAAPTEPTVIASEHLLKVFYAEHGTKADLLATIDGLRTWAEEELTRNALHAQRYLAGLGDYPDRAAILVLTGRFNAELAQAALRWAEWALTEVGGWPEDLTAARPNRAEMERQVRLNPTGGRSPAPR
ncbi:PadR family transcriptional regulator [Dactylosporangium aurantiacum]|uniref:PadR family transcriptional regulator n=1 Tax=Dactylosporangium aurantiacum TaxID=35754 RepID=A0A9Q9IR97_9ACTN|nr:PadR family transcriptional regulator [Dactylosporangium aurantiacum]MDG6110257.1 PadR family transcriptional regulator [Dactylosporangium aurantiacum]UWZ58372.1 PadR family transcriptional regulator [Dactylosporangium aurantiacum]